MNVTLKPYPEYRDTGHEWLGQVPVHWNLFPTKRITRVNPSSVEVRGLPAATEVNVLPMERVSEQGDLDLSTRSTLGQIGSGLTYMRDGDVIVAKITPCFENGKGAFCRRLLNGIGFGSTEFHVLRPDTYVIDGMYLLYVTKSTRFRDYGKANMEGAGGQKRVTTRWLSTLTVPVPPLDEQRRIARYLDQQNRRVNRLIRSKQRLIALLNEQKQAIIQQVVTRGLDPNVPLKPSGVDWLGDVPKHWEVMRLGYAIHLTMGFPFSSRRYTDHLDDIRLLRGVNVTPGAIRWSETTRWPRSEYENLGDYHLQVGDLVVGMDRTLIAGGVRIATIQDADVPSLLLQRVARLRPTAKLSADYAYLLLLSKAFIDYLLPLFTGISVPHLSPKQIISFVVALPSAGEQAEIVKHVHEHMRALEQAIEQAHREIALIREYRTRLIADVVTGKLDVRGVEVLEVEHEEAEEYLDQIETDDEMILDEEDVSVEVGD